MSISTSLAGKLRASTHLYLPPRDSLMLPIGSNHVVNQSLAAWLTLAHPNELPDENLSTDGVNYGVPDIPREPNQTTMISLFDVKMDSDVILQDDSPWQVVGEDLLVTLTAQDVTRLVNIFPGASSFDSDDKRNCVFDGHCFRCGRLLNPDTAFLDSYDCRLYCVNCHQLQEAIIPRDVINNWDFSSQPVSQPTKSFLSGLYHKPVVNLAHLNPTLYAVIPELMLVRQLRRALVLLWHQIVRCDAKAAVDLRTSLEALEYMLFSVKDLDLFSMRDLCRVHSGQLERTLTSAITDIALAHVNTCRACRRRALICDVCENLCKPIWTHEFTTYKYCATPGCSNVMHVDCLIMEPESLNPCLSCHNPKTLPLSTRCVANSTCRACTFYAKSLPLTKLGHYSDPFPRESSSVASSVTVE